MNFKFFEVIPSLLITLALLIILDVFSASIIPAFGIQKFKLAFNILIILFLAFKVDTPFLPIIVLLIQIFNSAFSIEGWAHGAFAGVLVCMLIGYVKEMLHFSTFLSTIVVTEIFQLVWFLVVNTLVYIRVQNLTVILERFWWFIPESLVLALMSPVFFSFMERIWKVEGSESGVHA